jgi:uncharacterized membrane protein
LLLKKKKLKIKEENNMDGIKKFFSEYAGAIIGAIIALIILFTRLYDLILGIILVALGIFVGNYVQKNKYDVKEKLKNLIDRM